MKPDSVKNLEQLAKDFESHDQANRELAEVAGECAAEIKWIIKQEDKAHE